MSDTNSRGTVLVVDDEPAVRGMLADALEFDGFTVLQAEDAAQAIACIEANGKDLCLVLLDVNLPGRPTSKDAWDAVRKARADLPIVVMSGDAADAAQAGLPRDPFLAKPFRMTTLAETVKGLIS